MKASELTLAFIVCPLDDCIDAEHPAFPKWQVREALHNLIDDYIDKLMTDDDYAQIGIGGREGIVKKI